MPWFRIGLVAYIALCALGVVASVIAAAANPAYIVACVVCGYGLGQGLSTLYSDLTA